MTTPPHKSSADGKVRVGKLVPLAVIVAIVMATLCGVALWMRPELFRHHKAVEPEDPLIAAARKVGAEAVPDLVAAFTTKRVKSERVSLPERILWKLQGGEGTPILLEDGQGVAAFRLAQLGPQAKAAIPAMITSLKDPDGTTRLRAVEILESIGPETPEVVPALVQALHHPNSDTAYSAAEALTRISSEDKSVVPTVIKALSETKSSQSAEYPLLILEAVCSEAREAVPVLIECLNFERLSVSAVKTLGNIGPDAAAAVPALLQLYEQSRGDDRYVLRRSIILTLGRIGPAARESSPLLLELAKRDDLDAATALQRMDPQYRKLAIDLALRKLQLTGRGIWRGGERYAIDLLGEIGAEARTAVQVLNQVMDGHPPDDDIPFYVAWALWRIDPQYKTMVVPVFQKFRGRANSERDYELHCSAVGALWQIAPELRDELRPALAAILDEWKTVPARRHPSSEMKTLLPALTEIAKDDTLPDLRPWALRVIRSLNRVTP